MLHNALPFLASPVSRILFVKNNPVVDVFPDAGESALAKCSLLNHPIIAQKAVAKSMLGKFDLEEVLEGELSDKDIVQIQVWNYEPLVAGLEELDAVSLALSLAGEGGERISGELDALFDEEGLWQ